MLTLALAQTCHPADGDVPALVERFASQAAQQGVDLLAFPECLMTRYDRSQGDFAAAAQPLDGPYCRALDAIAARYGLWMLYTVNEANPGDRPYNTAVLVDGEGRHQLIYRKVHLFDTDFTRESDRMSAGDRLADPVDSPWGPLAMAVCYDLRFPEVARRAALRGARLMLYPAAWVDGPGKADQWRTLLQARAIENEMFVAGICRADKRTGAEGSLGYVGRSCVIDPLGRVVAEAGEDEQLLVASVDLDLMDDVRRRMPVFQHRHPELY